MQDDAAAHVGKELAALIRSAQAGQSVDGDEVWNMIERVARSSAASPSDALASLAIAKVIVMSAQERLDEAGNGSDAYCLGVALVLLHKAIGALEAVTGERETAFTGHAPALN